MHFVTLELGLVCTDHREKSVLFEKLVHCILPEEIRAPSNFIRFELSFTETCIIVDGVRP